MNKLSKLIRAEKKAFGFNKWMAKANADPGTNFLREGIYSSLCGTLRISALPGGARRTKKRGGYALPGGHK